MEKPPVTDLFVMFPCMGYWRWVGIKPVQLYYVHDTIYYSVDKQHCTELADSALESATVFLCGYRYNVCIYRSVIYLYNLVVLVVFLYNLYHVLPLQVEFVAWTVFLCGYRYNVCIYRICETSTS